MESLVYDLLGREGTVIALPQMLARAVAVFFIGLFLLRLATTRLFSKLTPVDIVLAVIVGSNLSRTLTGNAPFVEVIAATVLLIALHALLTAAAARWRPLADVLKGKPHPLVQRGEIDWKMMHRHAIGERDLLMAVRAEGGTDIDRIRTATLERGGGIQVILKG